MIFQDMLFTPRPILLTSCSIPRELRILVLAPHPDDFDEISVTLKYFRDNGNPIFVSVLSSGASGVEDGFCTPSTTEAKAGIREDEQRKSCSYFGLRHTHLEFLRLPQDHEGHILENPENFSQIRHTIKKHRPAMVFLPHGNDTNADHRLTSTMFEAAASDMEFPLAAFFNKDPKTISMQYDFYTPFGSADAEWKAALLGFHASQQQRNLNTRGKGFDARVLETNQQIALDCPGKDEFAEAFEYAFWE